jgi:hypothetical protein
MDLSALLLSRLSHGCCFRGSPDAVVGMAVYTAKAMLHGNGHDVCEMIVENIP